jgi:alkanesulfonate monooxygenase SsuD/methylene tetrahydromethanopterin reductase-like flavin-dependent oxidoreductase (luciferase family)
VGTGRGSGFSVFEYTGFGAKMEEGTEMIAEAEELLIQAWTGDDVEHHGKYWDAVFPRLRPRPFQQPHPPLMRACASEESTIAMARLGRPVLFSTLKAEFLKKRLTAYANTMLESGFDPPVVKKALSKVWSQKDVYVGVSREEAQELAAASSERQWNHIRKVREMYNPPGADQTGVADESSTSTRGRMNLPADKLLDQSYLFGTADDVAEQVAELRDAGLQNLMIKFNTGQMPYETVEASMRRFTTTVAPRFQDSH